MTQRVLILGGGVGGTIVANRLVRRVRPGEAEIMVVDTSGRHVYQPGLLYLPFNHENPEDLARPVRQLLDRRVQFTQGTANKIDREEHTKWTAGRSRLTFLSLPPVHVWCQSGCQVLRQCLLL